MTLKLTDITSKLQNLASSTLLYLFSRFVASVGYYGLSFNAAGITNNKYLSIFISSFVELQHTWRSFSC